MLRIRSSPGVSREGISDGVFGFTALIVVSEVLWVSGGGRSGGHFLPSHEREGDGKG